MNLSRDVAFKQVYTRRWAASEQIEMAIYHLDIGKLASAITLSLAAEEQIPPPPADAKPHLLGVMRAARVDKQMDLNKIRNWLKHHKEPEEIGISEFESVVSVLRAVTKFYAVYGEPTHTMKKFLAWVRQEGFYQAIYTPS